MFLRRLFKDNQVKKRENMSSDYDEIVSHCLKNGELWEDPDFPPVQSSLFYHQNPPQTTFEWKRPHVRMSKVVKYFKDQEHEIFPI